jgi:hypothetical protein
MNLFAEALEDREEHGHWTANWRMLGSIPCAHIAYQRDLRRTQRYESSQKRGSHKRVEEISQSG